MNFVAFILPLSSFIPSVRRPSGRRLHPSSLTDKPGVCHVLLDYHPQTGGAEIQARRLAQYQREQGYAVCVLARRRLADPVEREWPACEEIDGLPVYRVPVRGRGRWAALSYFLGGLWLLFRHRREYQVLHAHMLTAPAVLSGVAGLLLRKRVVAKASGGGLRVQSNVSELQRSPASRWLLRHTLHRILAISREIAADLTQLGFPPEQVTYLPNGIDVHAFAPAAGPKATIRQRLGLPVDGLILVFTGRLRPVKNLAPLVEAVALLAADFPTLRLLLVGAGVERARLEQLAQTLNLADRVTFAGETLDVRPYLHAADVFALPSLKEGLSNAMLEAMAVGLPVLATAVGGAPDLIRPGENGVLLPPAPSPAQIVEALRPLLTDPARRQALGQRARQTVVEQCAFEVVGERILALYRELGGDCGCAENAGS